MMIDYSLRECPFCGNPAEIVNAELPEWSSGGKYKKIVCSNEYCKLRNIDFFRLLQVWIQSCRQQNKQHKTMRKERGFV